jgi:hypothetical protein
MCIFSGTAPRGWPQYMPTEYSNEFLKHLKIVQNEFNCSFFFSDPCELTIRSSMDGTYEREAVESLGRIHASLHVRTGRKERNTARWYGVGCTVKSAAQAQVTSRRRRRLCTNNRTACLLCIGTVSLESETVVLGDLIHSIYITIQIEGGMSICTCSQSSPVNSGPGRRAILD